MTAKEYAYLIECAKKEFKEFPRMRISRHKDAIEYQQRPGACWGILMSIKEAQRRYKDDN